MLYDSHSKISDSEKYVYNTNIMCLIQSFANFQNTKKN